MLYLRKRCPSLAALNTISIILNKLKASKGKIIKILYLDVDDHLQYAICNIQYFIPLIYAPNIKNTFNIKQILLAVCGL